MLVMVLLWKIINRVDEVCGDQLVSRSCQSVFGAVKVFVFADFVLMEHDNWARIAGAFDVVGIG
jgi:hypothetical protein